MHIISQSEQFPEQTLTPEQKAALDRARTMAEYSMGTNYPGVSDEETGMDSVKADMKKRQRERAQASPPKVPPTPKTPYSERKPRRGLGGGNPQGTRFREER